jgi:hypothetical protein
MDRAALYSFNRVASILFLFQINYDPLLLHCGGGGQGDFDNVIIGADFFPGCLP